LVRAEKTMIVRPMMAADIPAVARMKHALWELEGGVLGGPGVSASESAAYLGRLLVGSVPGIVFVAEADGVVSGCIVVEVHGAGSRPVAEVGDLFAARGCAGAGIALIRTATQWMADEGIEEVRVVVARSARAACPHGAFYRRLGFEAAVTVLSGSVSRAREALRR
jgi:hypothetical protein